jgi:hypothetical protein
VPSSPKTVIRQKADREGTRNNEPAVPAADIHPPSHGNKTRAVTRVKLVSDSSFKTMEQAPVQIGQFILGKNLGIGAFGKVRKNSNPSRRGSLTSDASVLPHDTSLEPYMPFFSMVTSHTMTLTFP